MAREVKTYQRGAGPDRKPEDGTVTYFSSEAAPAWTACLYWGGEIYDGEDRPGLVPNYGDLYLTLGDMTYHTVPVWAIEEAKAKDQLHSLAKIYEETEDAAPDILELFETYLELRVQGAIQTAELHQKMWGERKV